MGGPRRPPCAGGDHRLAPGSAGGGVVRRVSLAGLEVLAHASCAEVESTKSVSEIYAPVTGTVVEVNAALVDEPELVNKDPYGRGWILLIEMADAGEVAALLDASAYRALVDQG